jgi:hypothetical protein
MASVFRPKGRRVYRIKFRDQYDVERTVSSERKDRRCAEALAAKIEHDAERLKADLPPYHVDITAPYRKHVGHLPGGPEPADGNQVGTGTRADRRRGSLSGR